MPLFIKNKIKNYISNYRKRAVSDLSAKANNRRLQKHPYPEQFLSEMDFPETGSVERFLLIASTPRCGSHYLGHILGKTGECGVPLEYLNEGNKVHWERRFNKNCLSDLFPEFIRYRTSPNGTFTLKAHWHQYEPYINSLNKLTRGAGFEKVIWIYRRDQLAQAISQVIAEQTGAWISGSTQTVKAEFDYDAIVRCAKSIRHSNLMWRDHTISLQTKRCIALVYEDLLYDNAVWEKLREFLGLTTELKPSARTRQQSSEMNTDWKKRFSHEVRYEDLWILGPPAWLL